MPLRRLHLPRRTNPVAPATPPPGDGFAPRRMVRQGHVQTLLARRLPADSVALRTEQPMLLEAGPDQTGADPDHPVRLLGYYNAPLDAAHNRGLVEILHGWHGSSHSSDVLYIADALLNAGYSVLRLNARDHGPNRHFDKCALNPGLFWGTLLDEMLAATRTVALLAGDRPFALVGGSLGGNFVLRLAAAHTRTPIPNLTRVIALCPAVNPGAAAAAIDQVAPYRVYFRARWLQGLHAKQRDFPDRYDFRPVERMRSIVAMTEYIVRHYSPYADAAAYFDAYRVTPEALAALRVPTTIIAARNDAVVPVADILAFAPHANLEVQVHATGGHMGFVDIFPYRRWLPQTVLRALED